MEWFGPSNRIEYIEEGDALLIRITGLTRWIDLVWPIGFGTAAGVAAYCQAALWCLGLAGFCVLFAYKWFSPSHAELHATSTHLRARVTTGSNTTRVERRWSEIYGLQFSQGPGENDPSGLYTQESEYGGGALLIGQLNREEADGIIKVIYTRFYSIPTRSHSSQSMLGRLQTSFVTLFGGEKE